MNKQSATASGRSALGRRLFDLLNVPLLAIVAVCFFLPLCQLTCGPINARFSGVNLAVGTPPTIEGADGRQSQEATEKEKIPTDPLLLLVPLAAVAGAIICLRAVGQRVRAGSVAGVAAGLAFALLMGYAILGFGVERKVEQDKQEKGRDSVPVTTEKTSWFYLALIGSGAATALASLNRFSPVLQESPPAMEETHVR